MRRTRTVVKSRSLARRTVRLGELLLPYYKLGKQFGIRVRIDGTEYGIYHVQAKAAQPARQALIDEVADMATTIMAINPDARKLNVDMLCSKCAVGDTCKIDGKRC